MSRLEFHIEKAKFLVQFIWWREWGLVRDEWGVTYAQMLEAKENYPEIEKNAIERILKELSDEEGIDLSTEETK